MIWNATKYKASCQQNFIKNKIEQFIQKWDGVNKQCETT
jgi:hypothetical protein